MHDQKVLKVAPSGTFDVVVQLADDQPSGLGWLPNGDLLIVAMSSRRLLRFDGTEISVHADLSELASGICNDMVVDSAGRAYVGNFGFDLHHGAAQRNAELILVEPDGKARCVDDELLFPNGTVITPDDATLIIAETFAGRLTAFDLDASGEVSNRRVWAQLPEERYPMAYAWMQVVVYGAPPPVPITVFVRLRAVKLLTRSSSTAAHSLA